MNTGEVRVHGALYVSGEPLTNKPVELEIQIVSLQSKKISFQTTKKGEFSFLINVPENMSDDVKKATLIFKSIISENIYYESKESIQISERDVDIKNLEMRITTQYLIATGNIDFDRISILNKLYNVQSIEFLRLKNDMNVLTIGCGIGLLEQSVARLVGEKGKVLAVDKSIDQINLAQKQGKIDNLEFRQLDMNQIDTLTDKYDRIHVRFVLSHMPWQVIEKMLPILLKKLSPEGALVLEEITTLETLNCGSQYQKGYELWKKAFYEQFELQGSDPKPGKRLLDYFNQLGCEVISNSHQPIMHTKHEKSILRLGIISLEKIFLEKGKLTKEEIEEWKSHLEDLEQDETSLPRYVEVTQLFITKAKRDSSIYPY